MFAISPRPSNDLGLWNLMEQLSDPFSRHRFPVEFTDGTVQGRANGFLGDSQIQNTDKEFRIRLDLGHYKPEEVKIVSDSHRISIHAKHEERQDNHGYVSREMKRIYKLPKNVDPQSATSTMNDKGTLFIKLDKTALEAPKEVKIPVEYNVTDKQADKSNGAAA